MDMTHRRLNSLTVLQKLQVIQAVREGNQKKKDIAASFGIPRSTLSTILKNAPQLQRLAKEGRLWCKRNRDAEYPDVEACMIDWFRQCRDSNTTLGGALIREKAEYFAKTLGHDCFKASNGWLENFKKRQNLVFRKICGESSSVEERISDELEPPEVTTVPAPSTTSSFTVSPDQRTSIPHTPTANDLITKATHYLETEDDECLTLAKAYATKLRKLTPEQLMFADKVINDTLLDAQMGLLTRNTHLIHS